MVQSRDSESILKENYQATTYKGEAPPPLSQCTEDLPWEKLAKQEKEAQEKVHDKKKEGEEKKEENRDQSAVSSFVGKATEVVATITNVVGEGLHKITRDATERIEEAQKNRFKERFPVDQDESLMYEYSGYVLSGDTACSGNLYVSTDHVGFYSDCGDYRMKLWIPFQKVQSIQRGVALTRKDGKGIFIQLVESEEVFADAILIYTDDNEVHKFYKIGILPDPISNYFDHAWNVLDHAWRGSKEEFKESKEAWKQNPWDNKDSHLSSDKDYDKDQNRDFQKQQKTDQSSYSRGTQGSASTVGAQSYGTTSDFSVEGTTTGSFTSGTNVGSGKSSTSGLGSGYVSQGSQQGLTGTNPGSVSGPGPSYESFGSHPRTGGNLGEGSRSTTGSGSSHGSPESSTSYDALKTSPSSGTKSTGSPSSSLGTDSKY